jgi:hypothetical protein
MSCPSARGLPNVPYKTPILSFPFLFPEAGNRKTRPSHIVFDHHCRTVCRVQGCCLFHPRHLASPRVHDRHLHLHLLASTSAKRLMRVFPPAARLLRSFRFRVSLFPRKLRLRLMPIQPVGMFSTRYFTCAGTIHIATMVPVEYGSKWLAHSPCEACKYDRRDLPLRLGREAYPMPLRVRVGVHANTTKQTQSPKYRRTRLEKDSANAQEANTLLLDGSPRPETVHVVTQHGLTEIHARLRESR